MAGLMIAIANSVSSNYVVGAAGPSYDPDAQAFFTAEASAGVTLTDSQKTAVNDLVVNLKAANIWSKMKALYPIVGGTATAHKFNLKNPLDTDAAFRLAFTGGWTHSATGMLPNGTNAYANTFFNPVSQSLVYNNNHISYYSRTSVAVSTYDFGSGSSLNGGTAFFLYRTGAQGAYDSGTGTANRLAWSGLNATGFFVGSSLTTNIGTAFRNGLRLQLKNPLTSVSMENYNFYLGGFNEQNTNTYYGNKECAFASIGDGLTELENQVFNQIVEGYQFALGRNINPTQSFYYNSSYNNETNAYLYSTQITDTTIQTATNTLVSDLKTAGIWSKMKAIYPMAGGTATTHKFNLVDSQDTNAAFRLSFVGGWTHSSLGATPNGTNAYAVTYLNTATNLTLNSGAYGFYSRTNSLVQSSDMGAYSTLPDSFTYIYTYVTGGLRDFRYCEGGAGNTRYSSATRTDGFFVASRTASNVAKGYRNGAIEISGSVPSSATSTVNLILGAYNNNGTAAAYSSRQLAFAFISTGLNDTENANLYTAVQNFQISLGRAIYVSPPTVSDADAQAFINAATIVDQAEATAVNNLVIGLKADSLWTKMKAVYPMVGSTASSQKYNLVNPLDTNAAFRLSFAGGWTHSFNGALPNGTNAYADTFLVPNPTLTNNNTHISIYSRTDVNGTYFDIGSGQATGQYFDLALRLGGSIYTDQYNNSTGRITTTNSASTGHYISTRTASNVFKLFKNNAQLGTTQTGASTGYTSITSSIYLAALHEGANTLYYSPRQCAFASIGDGLTDSEASNLYNRVQTFNTALQRQV